jgi:glutathione S-transferase
VIRLHDVFGSPFSRRVWIALEEKGLRHERVVHEYEACDAPDFPHPFHVTPVLEIDGLRLFESLAIVEYLDETREVPRLVPRDPAVRARARAFATACEMNFQPHYRAIAMALRDGRLATSHAEIRAAIEGMEQALGALDRELDGKTWLASDAFSIADLSWAPFLARAGEIGLRPVIDRFPGVARWLDRLLERPSVQASRVQFPWTPPAGWLEAVLPA